MQRPLRPRVASVFGAIGAAAGLWTLVLLFTGGVSFQLHTVTISSRNWRRPAELSVVLLVIAWTLAHTAQRDRVRRTAARLLNSSLDGLPPRTAPIAALVASIWVAVTGLLLCVNAVGGADEYGYVSQAHLWAAGDVRVRQPFVRDMQWPGAAQALGPLGYRPLEDGTTLVPMFPPGLPLTMAAFERVGGRDAVFYVVPILGALAVWATYLMGKRFAGRGVGAIGAILLSTSPAFLYQLLMPMTDVPVTAWWALCLALVATPGRASALGAGLAAGIAMLTRMNLAPLLVVPCVLLLLLRRDQPFRRRAQRLALFAAGVSPWCVAIAWINTSLYGSPFVTGLGTVAGQYDWHRIMPNLQRYALWLLQTEAPVLFVGLVAVLMLWRRERRVPVSGTMTIGWLAFSALVLASYVAYAPHDGWIWLRFLLPAFPPMLVLCAAALCAWLGRTGAVALVTLALATYGVAFARDHGTFTLREGEQKTRRVGEYIARRFSDRSIFISVHHSGSVRYYSGRLTVRFDLIAPDDFDRAVRDLRALQYQPYLVLEPWELAEFHDQFSGHTEFAKLDWPPLAELDHWTRTRIYDLAARDLPSEARPMTEIIH